MSKRKFLRRKLSLNLISIKKKNENKSNLDPKNDFSELDIDTIGKDKRPSTVAKREKNKNKN